MSSTIDIEARIKSLENELSELKGSLNSECSSTKTVYVPEEFEELFSAVEKKVKDYFKDFHLDPESGEITVFGERYVLLRSASVSYEFLKFIKERYKDRPESEAISIGNNFLYDNSKVIGKKDSLAFHKRLKLKDPIEKLSAGPVHFAYTGWANVEIFPESNPSPDDDYVLAFQHHNSFEAQSWIKEKKKSKVPVCTMNCGYSAGWCEESFGIPLTTVEITCEAKGDDKCTFIMAPPHKIEQYVEERLDTSELKKLEIPIFFKRQHTEEQLRESLVQKQILLQEIHHRVKNNLQLITSLLRLQMDKMESEPLKFEFESSINRINTMAVVHELMYQETDFNRIGMKNYFSDLIKSLIQLYSVKDNVDVSIDIDIEDRDYDLETSIPLALVLNEITCNSFKHALKDGGKFHLKLSGEENSYRLTIGDNGNGYAKKNKGNGLGLSLIEILCDQMEAQLKTSNSEKGLVYTIDFKIPNN